MTYRGSKRRIIKPLKEAIDLYISQRKPEAYIEPFVGGANVITEIGHPVRIGSDSNADIVDFLKFCKEDPTLSFCPEDVTKEMYLDIRNDFRTNGGKYSRQVHLSVGWLASFGGRFFDGGFGYSPGRNTYKGRLKTAKATASKLDGIELKCCPFSDYNPKDYKNCLFCCDPPYHNTSGYNVGFDYEEFCEWCRQMGENNTVLVSEYSMPSDFKLVFEVGINNLVSSYSDTRKKAVERLYVKE